MWQNILVVLASSRGHRPRSHLNSSGDHERDKREGGWHIRTRFIHPQIPIQCVHNGVQRPSLWISKTFRDERQTDMFTMEKQACMILNVQLILASKEYLPSPALQQFQSQSLPHSM